MANVNWKGDFGIMRTAKIQIRLHEWESLEIRAHEHESFHTLESVKGKGLGETAHKIAHFTRSNAFSVDRPFEQYES